jgi:hypothetical protein
MQSALLPVICVILFNSPSQSRKMSRLRVSEVVLHANSREVLETSLSLCQVSCLALSPSGRYLASGQLSFMGFPAPIIIWDLEERAVHQTLTLHKVSPA